MNLLETLKATSWKVKIFCILLVLSLGYFGVSKIVATQTKPITYQTGTAEKGTLITTVSASGNISMGGMMSITTQATGTVNTVYVKNGDTVTKGQKIADITLDQDGQQKQAQAWSSYLSAQNQVNSSQNSLYSLQATMLSKWKTYKEIAENSTYQNSDGSDNTTNRALTPFVIAQDDWLSAEASYKNQQNAIAQAQASLSNAWYSYQQVSPTITAPVDGTISGLTIAVGIPVTSTTTTNSSSNSTQKVGTITLLNGSTQAVVSLSEVDAVQVNADQKVTITMTAYPNKTFTGKVAIVDTNGTTSSNVTTYPATIVFDNAPEVVYPNMAVDAKIITNVKDNVILVPSAAVSTTNGESTVRIMNKGNVTSTVVEAGLSNDTQTEIISGVSEGDTLVTGSTNGTAKTTTGTTSIFGNIGRSMGGGPSR